MKREVFFVSISENHNVLIKAPGKIILSTIEFGILDGKLMKLRSGLVVLLVQYLVFTGTVLAGNIVINEFDLNPAGKDAGNEWVVLYNFLILHLFTQLIKEVKSGNESG